MKKPAKAYLDGAGTLRAIVVNHRPRCWSITLVTEFRSSQVKVVKSERLARDWLFETFGGGKFIHTAIGADEPDELHCAHCGSPALADAK